MLTCNSKVLDAELRTLSLTVQDAEVRLNNSSSQQQASMDCVLSDCHKVLQELQEYVGKFVELQPPNSGDGKAGPARHIKRLWKGLQWDSSAVNSYQTRITSVVTKLNALGQGQIGQDVDILVEHDDQKRELPILPLGSLVPRPQVLEQVPYERTRSLTVCTSIGRWELIEWISPIDHATTQRDVLKNRVDPSASRWFLVSQEFKIWMTGRGKTMFCPGIPGAGKTMTTAVTVEYLQSVQSASILTGYVYCMYQSHSQSAPQLLASVLRSLVQQSPRTPRSVQELFNTSYKLDKQQMSSDQVLSAITDITRSKKRTNVVVDALDELPRDDRNLFIKDLLKIQEEAGLNLIFTSRFHAEIEAILSQSLRKVIRATEPDVKGYLRASITRLPRFVANKDKLQVAIIQGIVDATDGM